MKTPLLLMAGFMLISRFANAQDGAGINWFEPSSAKSGEQVVISCRHFAADDSTQVLFNGLPAKIIKNSPDHLIALVPQGNSSGLITVSGPGIVLISRQKFTQVQDASLKVSEIVAPSPKTFKAQKSDKQQSQKINQSQTQKIDQSQTQKTLPQIAQKNIPPQTQKIDQKQAPKPEQSLGDAVQQPIGYKAVMESTNLNHPDEKGQLPHIKSEGQPLILGFSPRSGSKGTEIHISGLNFGFEKKDVSVSIKNTSLQVLSVYDQEIVVTVPGNLKESGNLVVVVSGKKSSSREQFKSN